MKDDSVQDSYYHWTAAFTACNDRLLGGSMTGESTVESVRGAIPDDNDGEGSNANRAAGWFIEVL